MTHAQAFWLAVVEGLTEYLPVSSTGHIILTSWLMGINQDPFVKDFTVMVQFGAILAVVVLFLKRFVLNRKLYPQVIYGVLPAIALGLLVKNYIDAVLGNVWVVGVTLLVGGVLLVLTDGWIKKSKNRYSRIEDLPPVSAVKIGLFQCMAFLPGVSRSAASIWGGIHQGLSLQLATEFSFFLAVPTLAGASLLKLKKAWPSLTEDQFQMLIWGNVVSFIVGVIAIRFFVSLLNRYGLKYFGYYRIAVGIAVLVALLTGSEISFL